MMRLYFGNKIFCLKILSLGLQLSVLFDELLDINVIQGISSEHPEVEFLL